MKPTKRSRPRTRLSVLRRATRREAHAMLDALLDGPSTMPDGSPGTVIDDLVARQIVGFGFTVELKCRHPNEPGRAVEDPNTTAQAFAPKSRIEIVQ